jgi:TonB-dependent SusC/RagA subfamily outer membrane receptor
MTASYRFVLSYFYLKNEPMKQLILLLVLIFSSGKLWCQEIEPLSIETLQDSVKNQFGFFPQEKLHVHTDRNLYVPGEKIWFKAYIVDALTMQAPTFSRFVYVELINSNDSLISRVMIRRDEKGLFCGHIFLADLIPEGFYTLRAYTRYMENMGEDYYFKKEIRISNLSLGSDDKGRKSRKGRDKGDYSVSFFPEGGYLLEGLFCKVAFKALNKNGYPEEITGELIDEEGTVICSATTMHAGMGSFAFIPDVGKKYVFKSKNGNGQERRFDLPTERSAITICTTNRNQQHFVSLNKTANCPDEPVYLLVHSRGILYYFAPWDQSQSFIVIPEELLPSGVIQFVLFDQEMNPLSERLVFNETDDQAKVVYTTDRSEYERREKVTSDIYIVDDNENRLAGNLSVAITDDRDFAVDSLTTILSSLLLSSELKGYIESPGYYLQDNADSKKALDLLMLTHGWRRYDLPEAFKGNYAQPKIPFEMGQELSGTLTGLLLGKPVANGEISIISLEGGFGLARTDSTGHFGLYDIDVPDSVSFFIQAKNDKGKNHVELKVNEQTFPKLTHIQRRTELYDDEKEKAEEDDFLKKAEQRAKYDEDIRLINLQEIEVVGKRIPKKDETRLQYWANASSDATMYREEIDRFKASRVTLLLMRMSGVMVVGNDEVRIRGASGPPLVVIDGSPIEWEAGDSPLEYVNVDDLESIDIFKGASAAIFGSRGGNGVISLTTRRGDVNGPARKRFNYASFAPLGYQKPVEFYAPVYDTPTAKNLTNPDFRTTIFWKPDLIVTEEEEGSKATFEFYTADANATTYSVVIEGITLDGKIIRQVEKITVK